MGTRAMSKSARRRPAMTRPISRSEFQRLGKGGSYRLGLLAPHAVARPAPSRQFRPSFSRPTHAGPTWAWTVAALGGAGLIALGANAGLWFAPLVVGVAGGVGARGGQLRLRVTVPAVAAMSALGWGAVLLGLALRGLPVGATARTIAAIG